jgi:hypothetical protein
MMSIVLCVAIVGVVLILSMTFASASIIEQWECTPIKLFAQKTGDVPTTTINIEVAWLPNRRGSQVFSSFIVKHHVADGRTVMRDDQYPRERKLSDQEQSSTTWSGRHVRDPHLSMFGVLVEQSKEATAKRGFAVYVERLLRDGKMTDETIATCVTEGD